MERSGQYYTDIGVDILWTGDLGDTEDLAATPDGPVPTGDLDLDGPGRRGFERYDLTASFVRASILPAPDAAGHTGRVTNASVTGMWVETDRPLPFRTEVDVDWCVMGSYSMRFPGKVVRSTAEGMAVVLDVDDESWRFRSSFIDLARTRSDEPPTVIMQPRTGRAQRAPPPSQTLDLLSTEWSGLDERLGDDEAHQAFIHACLKSHRLEYALERYRELKVRHPDSEAITRYIQQIGTILTFQTLSRRPPEPRTPWKKRGIILAALLAGIAVGSMTLAERLTSHRMEVHEKVQRQANLPPPPGAPRR